MTVFECSRRTTRAVQGQGQVQAQGQGRRRRGGTVEIEGLEDYAVASGSGSADWSAQSGSSWGSDAEDLNPRQRKQRRSNRVTATDGLLQTPEGRQGRPVPAIGSTHQADIPARQMLSETELRQKVSIMSKLVYDPSQFLLGDVDRYMNVLNERFLKRDGLRAGPFATEVALTQLVAHKGSLDSAVNGTMSRVPRGPFFPGLGPPASYDEQCLFARCIHERGKDFSYISRHVMMNRSRSQLVWFYYARHKQLRLQMGCVPMTIVVDQGVTDSLKSVPLSSLRAVEMLRRLACTAGDGFPVDVRLPKFLLTQRVRTVSMQARRRREADANANGNGLGSGNGVASRRTTRARG